MDKNTATKLIRDTFHNPFDKGRYVNFVKNLLNTIDESKAFSLSGQYVPEKFREFVKGYERIGTFIDPEGLKLDVLIVHLKSEAALARARTSQRNFISNYLKSRDSKDAGLIAFVSPNPADWRFSFVKMDYKFVEKKGKIKPEEDFTPARRYSFLVGSHESSHTAQRQLLPILGDDKHNPTLKLIENAFNIETVTKEFFEKYRDLFLHAKKELDALVTADRGLKEEFEKKGVNTADFTKKLLGQIVFLYFLQKKGWFGVERDAVWGSGHKDFLRRLFEGKLIKYKNFFDDVLEPLFYEALAVEGRDANFYSKFNCKIPFLNGGLFDPINGYDWVHTGITLSNDLFSNTVKTKEGDIGTGILDIFDRYNFTVKEDEPLEKEVAVDPEMLGKVFENLLEVNDRKSKGTYYTPREIVHYMCQESLINYLATELEGKVSKDDVAVFIRMGDTVIEHESRIVKKGEETETYSYKLPKSIRTHVVALDGSLASIRVCDPAIGSGAFPVGMMNEIVRARQTLTIYLPSDDDRSAYDFKRHAIQESLYGVDIDPGAVEIAKLRLWLSLIVDEDDIARIKPLPNLDYRIMQGNSLLEEFEGIRLFDEKLLETSVEDRVGEIAKVKEKMGALQQEYFSLHSDGKLTDERKEGIQSEIKRHQSALKQLQAKPEATANIGMFDTPSRVGEVLSELKILHRTFFEATQRKKKEEIKKKIESLEWELIDISLTEKKKGDLLAKLRSTRVRPFFLWKLHFADVFREKKGFDITIGNPPYVRADIDKMHAQMRKAILNSGNYHTLWEKWDLYVPFVERGYQLLKPGGVTTMIISDAFCHSKYAQKAQNWFLKNARILRLDFCTDLKFFDAAVHNLIYFFQRADGENHIPERHVHREKFGNITKLPSDEQAKLTGRSFFPEENLHAGFSAPTLPVSTICYVSFGCRPNSDEKRAKGLFVVADLLTDARDKNHPKPYIEAKDVVRWTYAQSRWLEWGTKRSPDLLARPTFEKLYEVPEKIVAADVSGAENRAAYDDSQVYHSHTLISFLPWHYLNGVQNNSLKKSARYRHEKPPRPDLPKREELEETSRRFSVKFLLGVMNSSAARDFLRSNRRSNIHLYPDDWKKLPIPDVTEKEQAPIVELVDSILTAKREEANVDISFWEREIDKLVDKLYAKSTADGRGHQDA